MRKLVPLEGCRGVASLIVVLHHCMLGFDPTLSGILLGSNTPHSLVNRWFFFVANGTGAVNFFFTLSGFVLYWTIRQSQKKNYQIVSIIKRYPRLVLPVSLTTVISWLLFRMDAYHFVEAAEISKSPWLAGFAYSGWTPNFRPGFWDAVLQGFTTFFTGQASYNTNLWTMKPEFIGSIFVFLMAPSVMVMDNKMILTVCYALVMLASGGTYPYLMAFSTGVFLSEISFRNSFAGRSISLPLSILLISTGAYLLGYFSPQRDFFWLFQLYSFLGPLKAQVVVHTTGSSLIIYGIMNNPRVYETLNGKLSLILGRLSFSIYLLHLQIIASVSSLFLVFLSHRIGDYRLVFLGSTVLTFLISLIVAALLTLMDEFWLRRLNLLFSRMS